MLTDHKTTVIVSLHDKQNVQNTASVVRFFPTYMFPIHHEHYLEQGDTVYRQEITHLQVKCSSMYKCVDHRINRHFTEDLILAL